MMKKVSCLMRHAKQLSTSTSSVRVELVSEKIIKPSSPTPKHLRHYKLSYLDQILPHCYMPITLFYSNPSTSALSSSSTSLSTLLEKSLAKLLSSYYPCAGRLVHNSHVDCNDKGIPFREVRVKGSMSETLTKNFSTVQETLFPGHSLPWTEPSEDGNIVVAQLTHFDCGALAISLCFSHKLGDGYTFCNILSDWAEHTRNSTSLINPPSFIGSSILQPKDDPFTPSSYSCSKDKHLSVSRLRFTHADIKRLKAIVSSESDVKDPTRFEVVSAMVNICATKSSDSYNSLSGSFDPFNLYVPMNLRRLINPNVPYLFGNFISPFFVEVSEDGDLKLPKLVSKIREEKIKHLEIFQGKNNDGVFARFIEMEKRIPKHYTNLHITTTLCTYPLYNIDFGWGRPTRVTAEAAQVNNCFMMFDAPEKGGVDVIGTLDQSDALKFKANKDVLDVAEVDLAY